MALAPAGPGGGAVPLAEFLRKGGAKEDARAERRLALEEERLKTASTIGGRGPGMGFGGAAAKPLMEAKDRLEAFTRAGAAMRSGDRAAVASGKLGVDLAVQMGRLRGQSRLENVAVRQANGRRCLEVGGVWVDEKFDAKMPMLVVKAQSDAYFRILELQPDMKDVYRLGNHLVWITPSGTALVIDTSEGKEKMGDEEINKLFVTGK
jgi:Ca-activated chloride channel family protein